MQEPIFSKTIKQGKTTFFVDVREAKNGNKFVSVAQTFMRDNEPKRYTIRIFGAGTLLEIITALQEAIEHVEEQHP